MPQCVSEQEEYVECNIIQDDQKMQALDIEADSTDIQLNKEANNLSIQPATEFHTVSNLLVENTLLILINTRGIIFYPLY